MTTLRRSADCAILCQEPLFRAFMRQHERLTKVSPDTPWRAAPNEPWVFVRTKEDAAIAVRFLLDIDSRRELDTDPAAATRWAILKQEFQDWKDDIS